MKIAEQAGVYFIEHKGPGFQRTLEELRQLRGMTSVQLRTYFRQCLFPNVGKKEREALAQIAKDIDLLPAVIEEFLARREESSSHDDGGDVRNA